MDVIRWPQLFFWWSDVNNDTRGLCRLNVLILKLCFGFSVSWSFMIWCCSTRPAAGSDLNGSRTLPPIWPQGWVMAVQFVSKCAWLYFSSPCSVLSQTHTDKTPAMCWTRTLIIWKPNHPAAEPPTVGATSVYTGSSTPHMYSLQAAVCLEM